MGGEEHDHEWSNKVKGESGIFGEKMGQNGSKRIIEGAFIEMREPLSVTENHANAWFRFRNISDFKQ